MAEPEITVRVLGAMADIDEKTWDGLSGADGDRPEDPFTTYRFLHALEASGSVGPGTGWQPRHLVAFEGETAIAAMPLYAKGHSQGEYVFDFSWANAYERAGGRYYPKLQAAIPFTPATGRRFLTQPEKAKLGTGALVEAAIRLASEHQLSSFHITFCTEAEALAGQAMGLQHRTGQQFHWENAQYGDFDDFLGQLSSRKRKTIRRERQVAQAFGGDILLLRGQEIQPDHWDAFWEFYQDTGARKWGTPYLTRDFFTQLHQTMREDVLLMMCRRNGRYVAGALNFIGRDTLYGRYWGCSEHHPFLHFELCYYQAIEFAIAEGLSRVEAGAQGEHKLARGYLPVQTHSLHWIADPGFREAVEQFLQQERRVVDEDIEILTSYGPFRRGGEEPE